MYLPPLLPLHQPPNDPMHKPYPPAEASAAIYTVVLRDSAILGFFGALCFGVVLGVETVAAAMPEAVAD